MSSASEDVTAALRAVEQLSDDDLAAHVPAYEAVYRALQDRLADAEN